MVLSGACCTRYADTIFIPFVILFFSRVADFVFINNVLGLDCCWIIRLIDEVLAGTYGVFNNHSTRVKVTGLLNIILFLPKASKN